MNGWFATLRVLLGDMRRKPGPALATVVAMAAGVAVFVAIWLAGTAARSSFVSAVEAVAGRATHEVTRPGGLDEARFADFAVLTRPPVREGSLAEWLPGPLAGALELSADGRAAVHREAGTRVQLVEITALDVSSSDFPKFHAHTNRVGPWAEQTGADVAEQVVFGRRVVLPVEK